MEIKNLGDCVDLIIDYRGKTPQKMGSDWSDEGYRVISAKNVHYGMITDEDSIRCVNEDIYSRWMKEEIKRGDCFLASEGASLGESAIWDSDEKVVLGQRLFAIRADGSNLDPWYLAYYLQTEGFREQINQSSTGSTVFGISQPILCNLQLMLPDIAIQRRIGDLYKHILYGIKNNYRLVNELELMLKTIYEYWFVQFDFPDDKGMPYKDSSGPMEKTHDGVDIPKGWRRETLKNKYRIEKGLSYSSDDIKSGEGIAMINLACIDIHRNYRDGQLKYHAGNVPSETMLKAGDMLIACTDLTRNADIVGCPILVPDDGADYTYSTDIAKIYSVEEGLDNMYLYMTLRTDSYHNYIKKWASGTNVLHLNLDGLDWYEVNIPPIELQKRYSVLVKEVHNRESQILKENRNLVELKNTVLPMLMNGQAYIQ